MIKSITVDKLGTVHYHEADYIGKELESNGIFESHVVKQFEKIVKPTDIVVDIGANIGLHTLLLSKLAYKVIAIEPCLENYMLLQENLFINKIFNVSSYMMGTSDKEETPQLVYYSETNTGLARFENSSLVSVNDIRNIDRELRIQCMPLDNLNLKKVDLIKIDTEGYEYRTIVGAEKTIKAFKPIIVFEDWTGETFPLVESLGYEIKNINNDDGGESPADFLAIYKGN